MFLVEWEFNYEDVECSERRDTLARWILSDLTITVSDPISHPRLQISLLLFLLSFPFSFFLFLPPHKVCTRVYGWMDRAWGSFFIISPLSFFNGSSMKVFYGGINDLVAVMFRNPISFFQKAYEISRASRTVRLFQVFCRATLPFGVSRASVKGASRFSRWKPIPRDLRNKLFVVASSWVEGSFEFREITDS